MKRGSIYMCEDCPFDTTYACFESYLPNSKLQSGNQFYIWTTLHFLRHFIFVSMIIFLCACVTRYASNTWMTHWIRWDKCWKTAAFVDNKHVISGVTCIKVFGFPTNPAYLATGYTWPLQMNDVAVLCCALHPCG